MDKNAAFIRVRVALVRDESVSLAARAVLISILSEGPKLAFSMDWLKRAHGLGKERAYSIVNELIACGYCSRTQARVGGKAVYLFTDTPHVFAGAEVVS